jgi:hypothetical protein
LPHVDAGPVEPEVLSDAPDTDSLPDMLCVPSSAVELDSVVVDVPVSGVVVVPSDLGSTLTPHAAVRA